MRATVAAFLLVPFIFLSGAKWAVATDTYTIRGSGTQSCGTWLEDRKVYNSLQNAMDTTWVLGFLTGMNAMDMMTRRSGGGKMGVTTDVDGLFAWVDNYCRANPLKTISDAALALATELVRTNK